MAIPSADRRGGGMDDHLDGSHLGDTGHVGWFDGSWKGEREKQKEKAGIIP